jgi:F0F1-type ATP synthase assembly protein I
MPWKILAAIGSIIALIGAFLPWYTITVDVETGSYRTDGDVDVVTLDGMGGAEVNQLENMSDEDQQDPEKTAETKEVMSLGVPFGVLVLIGAGLGFLAAAKDEKNSLSTFLIIGGVINLVIGFAIIGAVSQSNSMLEDQDLDIEDPAVENLTINITEDVSDKPFGGDSEETLAGHEADVKWGPETGLYLIIIGGLFCLVIGIVARLVPNGGQGASQGGPQGQQQVSAPPPGMMMPPGQ